MKQPKLEFPSTVDELVDMDTKKDTMYLLPENCLIDTTRIDEFQNGKVLPQAVDLKKWEGNERILGLLDEVKEKEGIFFLGTLLGEYQGIVLPTMPVISNGELIYQKVKGTAYPLIDDYSSLAERWFDQKFAKKIKNFSGLFVDEPMKTLQNKINDESNNIKQKHNGSVLIEGMRILPVICNEVSDIASNYQGAQLSIILHACNNKFEHEEGRLSAYESMCKTLKKRKKIKAPFFIGVNEIGDPNFENYSGILRYDKSLREVSQ